MFKAILGYSIHPSLSQAEFEQWMFDTHVPDLLSNPHLDQVVLNTVTETVATASDGSPITQAGPPMYRIAELHFADEAAFRAYREWLTEQPLAPGRGSGGKADFQFYVLTESQTFTRD